MKREIQNAKSFVVGFFLEEISALSETGLSGPLSHQMLSY